jgi:hypothetical protein
MTSPVLGNHNSSLEVGHAAHRDRYPDPNPMCSRTAIAVFLAAGVLSILVCDPRSDHTTPLDSNTVSVFQEIIRTDGAVTFRSWEGKALRKDSDTEFAFFPEGRVEMLEYGFGLTRYAGSYEILGHGQIAVRLEGRGENWPDMQLERDGSTLLLRPMDPKVGFVMGNRGGVVISADDGSYWPFHEVTGGEKSEILATLEELRRISHDQSK